MPLLTVGGRITRRIKASVSTEVPLVYVSGCDMPDHSANSFTRGSLPAVSATVAAMAYICSSMSRCREGRASGGG